MPNNNNQMNSTFRGNTVTSSINGGAGGTFGDEFYNNSVAKLTVPRLNNLQETVVKGLKNNKKI